MNSPILIDDKISGLSKRLSIWACNNSSIPDWPPDQKEYWGEIYIIMVQAIRGWNKKIPLVPWVIWKTIREWLKYKRDYYRKELLGGNNLEIAEHISSESDPERSIWIKIDLERFIASQPPKRQQYLRLRLEGYTGAEIAEKMRVSESAVGSYMYEIHRNLKRS